LVPKINDKGKLMSDNKYRSVEHAARLVAESNGRISDNRGGAFRRSSTSNPDDWRDNHGVDVGAQRNDAHHKAAVAVDAESERTKEQTIEKRTREAKQREKETRNMAKEELDEAKKFVFDKPMASTVKAYSNRDTSELKDIHARWSKDHSNPKNDPITSEKLLAVHHVLKGRGESVELPKHKNLGLHMNEETNTEKRMQIKNVARPNDPAPTSKNSTLGKQGSIEKRVMENYGLSKDLVDITRQILERKTEVEVNPDLNTKTDDETSMKKESKHTTPKTPKEKKLAALAHPKDKITHKDVLVGRGVFAKEDIESELVEVRGAFTDLPSPGRQADVRNFGFHSSFSDKKNKEAIDAAKRALGARGGKVVGVPDSHKHLMGEEVEFSDAELEHINAILGEGELNELKQSTLGSYVKKASKNVAQRSTDLAKAGNILTMTPDMMDKAQKYLDKTKKRAGMIDKAVDRLTKEELELDEARGRPKKSGKEAEGDDTHKHPIQQLTKISLAIQGNEPHFEHKDGSKSKITKQLARHITTAYNAMRTSQEKDEFATKLHANRDSMMAAVKSHV
jgi:hypothetical protein